MRIPPRLLAGAVVTASTITVLTVPALARTTTTSTTSTTSTTTTTEGGDDGGDDERSTTTTTERPRRSTTTSSSTSTTAPPSTTTSTSSTTLAPGDVPSEVQAMIDAYPRTPPGSTRDLVDALAVLPAAAAVDGFGRFPVAGLARWSHDWLFPRHVPDFHVHEGIDIFAAAGTPVRSPAAGTAQVREGPVGGLAVTVVQDDGTYWYLAHLASATVADGATVMPGVVVATVGSSGNARGGRPHVHLEIHPHGGEAHDPKAIVDQMYAEALAAAPDVVLAYRLHARLSADAHAAWLTDPDG